MEQETVVAAPSAAAVETKITNFDGWDEDGTPVVTKKETPKTEAADSSTADTSKETKTPDDAADSAANKTQGNKRKPDVEERFKKLTETHKEKVAQLQRELEEARKGKETKANSAESPAAKPPGQKTAADEPTRPKPTMGDKGPDGKAKYANYDAYYEDLGAWSAEQTLAKNQREQQTKARLEETAKHVKEVEARYPDFKAKAAPLVHELSKGDSNPIALDRLNRSTHLTDVLYTIGSNAESTADFLAAMRTDPGKAIEVIVLMEQEIAKELAKNKPAAKTGAETETTPARPKPRAPEPPKEVGGRGATADDAALTAAKAGNFRDFEAEQNRRALAPRK